MRFINCTPHKICLNDGSIFEPSGHIARCQNTYSSFDENGIASVGYGKVEGLPEPEENVTYIVSGILLSACPERIDLVAPATGHPDTIRKDGQIASVPGFVR